MKSNRLYLFPASPRSDHPNITSPQVPAKREAQNCHGNNSNTRDSGLALLPAAYGSQTTMRTLTPVSTRAQELGDTRRITPGALHPEGERSRPPPRGTANGPAGLRGWGTKGSEGSAEIR